MSHGFLDIAISPSIHAAQRRMGVAHLCEQYRGGRTFDRFGSSEQHFIATRDSFYIASVSETGWPYVQHRGGPQGFMKLIGDRTIAFADYSGNRQYISVGNVDAESRACLFLMDYPQRARLKIYGRVEILELDADLALTKLVTIPEYRANLERVFKLTLEAFDWNCSQHITPRFSELEISAAVEPLRSRLDELEVQNAALRARLAALGQPDE
jgi:predicted pyridoxine 5'-phosphate oxidase superfamily flavin-nucleotide-binding protein